jgi:hypothetical protein
MARACARATPASARAAARRRGRSAAYSVTGPPRCNSGPPPDQRVSSQGLTQFSSPSMPSTCARRRGK